MLYLFIFPVNLLFANIILVTLSKRKFIWIAICSPWIKHCFFNSEEKLLESHIYDF